MTKPTLEIEYCTSCNYLPRALWVCAELMPDFQYDLEAVVLRCGTRGAFEVRFDGELLFSKGATGRFPEPDELKQLVFEKQESRAQAAGPANG